MYQGNGNIIDLAPILGGTQPEVITQNSQSGVNDIKSAKSTLISYPYTLQDVAVSRQDVQIFEKDLQATADNFNRNSKYVNVYLFS